MTHSGNVADLEGATLTGEVAVWLGDAADAASLVKQVTYSLDGRLVSVESFAPFDLFRTTDSGLAYPVDTALFSDGQHTVIANVLLLDGSRRTVTATFTVANGSAAKRIVYAGSVPLDGATVTRERICVGFAPTTGLRRFELAVSVDNRVVSRLGDAEDCVQVALSRGPHRVVGVVRMAKGVSWEVVADVTRM